MSFPRPFWIAMQLLTRLPTPRTSYDEIVAGRSLFFYPVVGVLIGTICSAAGWLLVSHVPSLPLAALLLMFWVMLTGALHLDGLADSADGWLGGHGDRERTLQIMHDSRSGPAAIVAVALVLLLKFSAMTIIVEKNLWLELPCIPLLARTLLPLLFLTTRCAQPDGMAASLARHLPRRSLWLVILPTSALVALFVPTAMWMLFAALFVFILLRRLMLDRIGGVTGDTAGALIEISEATMLLVLSIS